MGSSLAALRAGTNPNTRPVVTETASATRTACGAMGTGQPRVRACDNGCAADPSKDSDRAIVAVSARDVTGPEAASLRR
jgi:hypothetical protein